MKPTPARSSVGPLATAVLIISLSLLVGGGILGLAGASGAAHVMWAVTTLVGLGSGVWWVWSSARKRRLGVDVIAVLALIGTLAVGEFLAGAVVTVMLATGRVLEARAAARARSELRVLRERAPRLVHRVEGEILTSPSIEDVRPGDLLLVRPGEIVPVDGRVERDLAVLDESALTGESLPIERRSGDDVRSGAVNAGDSFMLRATRPAAESTYTGIVRLVAEAEADASSAPFVRLADRYAVAFLAVSLAVAGLAWMSSGDAVRAVAVLVVATPCPLILAAPIAITSGLSRMASRGVDCQGRCGARTAGRGAGGAVGQDGHVDGRSACRHRHHPGRRTICRQRSYARPLRSTRCRPMSSPRRSFEPLTRVISPCRFQAACRRCPGAVCAGWSTATRSRSGKQRGSRPWPIRGGRRRFVAALDLDGAITVFVAIDDAPAGAFLLDDPVRPDAARTIRDLRRSGIRRVVMVSGDRADVAESVGVVLGVDTVLSECSPADKVDVVIAEQALRFDRHGRRWHQRCTGAGTRRRRSRDGSVRA